MLLFNLTPEKLFIFIVAGLGIWGLVTFISRMLKGSDPLKGARGVRNPEADGPDSRHTATEQEWTHEILPPIQTTAVGTNDNVEDLPEGMNQDTYQQYLILVECAEELLKYFLDHPVFNSRSELKTKLTEILLKYPQFEDPSTVRALKLLISMESGRAYQIFWTREEVDGMFL